VKRTRFLLVAPLLSLLFAGVEAHEVRPGYLAVRQTDAESFDVLWKVPARGDLRLSLQARLPESCRELAPRSSYLGSGASTERWSVSCPGGLTGHSITIDGLSGTMTDVLVRLERTDGTSQVKRLSPSAPSFVVEASPSALQVAGTYLGLGVEHILLGIDHLLFVLALLILVGGGRRLVATVTAFTVAHSLTLGAATLGLVNVPQAPVEAIIALSIVFVACEIVHARQGKPGLTQRWPWIVAFTFGLLHGFGFAGALTEIGLPAQAVPLALLFFNVGVELGQLLFIAAVGVVLAVARYLALPQPAWAWRVPAYGIGTLAAFWSIERVVGFWN
jgi:hydrogenase/urease accessory protein HupE